MKKLDIPINSHLPPIKDETGALQRTKDEIALRAMSLLMVAVKGEGLEQKIVDSVIQKYGLLKHLTPNERAFIENPSPTKHEKIQFLWRYEAAWVLLWSLGYVSELGVPKDICDVPAAVSFMQERTREKFIANSKLRPISEILDQSDLIYRYHWAVVDARINNRPTPASLDPGVVMERHYALNWLIGYMGQKWDDVTTDT